MKDVMAVPGQMEVIPGQTENEAGSDKPDLRSMLPGELAEYISGLGEPKYRAEQLFSWLHAKRISSLEEATNLPAKLRKRLAEETGLTTLTVQKRLCSERDATRKYLYGLPDRNVIESVYMEYSFGSSVCISSQVGCAMGCRFCASTIDGVVRNLTAAEMLEQIYRTAEDTGVRISHTVVMGSGEPLENTDELIRFIRLITDPGGYGMSMRNITVSTCGIIPGIRRLAAEGMKVNLALSLHAPDQETREKLMPVAKRYGLDEVLAACREYYETTGRQLTFEYALAEGINDSPAAADRLAKLIRGYDSVVNLIPVNPVEERDLRGSSREKAQAFKNQLEKKGIRATIRRELGRDINGACGQLRRSVLNRPGEDKR